MSFLFEPAFGVVDLKKHVVRALGNWENRITMTTPKDIRRATAELVFSMTQQESGVVYVAGDTISYGQVADLLDKHFSRKYAREVWDLPTLRARLSEVPDDAMANYRETFAHGYGVAWDKEKTLNARRGMEMTDVTSYLQTSDFKSMLSKAAAD